MTVNILRYTVGNGMSLHNVTFHWPMSGFTLLAALAFGAKHESFTEK